MIATRALHQLLDVSALRFPDNVAVEETESGSIRYGELAHLSDRVRDRLRGMGVGLGDRVGICMRKSGDAVASIFGIMKAGAAYVPVDSTAPASRNALFFITAPSRSSSSTHSWRRRSA
jgi:acyl-CoA synthetase (AMP-forming)/AMP-acid ligase II